MDTARDLARSDAWQESTEDGAKVEITNVGLALVSSTEVVDAHWNDAVAFFMWYP